MVHPSAHRGSGITLWVPVFAALSWGGLFVHNLADLPGQTLLSPESFVPLLLTVALIFLWFTPLRVAAAWGLLVWGLLNFAVALVTVLPLSVFPFETDQSRLHYTFHVLYGVSQLPLAIATSAWLRRHGSVHMEGTER